MSFHSIVTRDELGPPNRLVRIVGDDILSFRQIGASWRGGQDIVIGTRQSAR